MAPTSSTRAVLRLRRPLALLAVAVVGTLVLGACQPERPSDGRGTPVRRVLIVGDSMTHGLFGTTPRVHERLVPLLADRGITTRIGGSPGSTILRPWPGQARWTDIVRGEVASFNPDVVIIQSTLFPGGRDRARQQAYLAEARALFSVAGSRGAHVYMVAHPDPPGAKERTERDVARFLQTIASGPRVSMIPLDWWLARCAGGTSRDGWHLSGAGQDCHALAVTVAIDQLRERNG